ncbi:hypothetical protein CLIB1423_34S00518 [[Candida] railenensis]|uniref:Uncharacterized protein n=1 Tax=[Candida] railenensis TaxID=45579 RepID=A0A9P0QUC3_9ASCO|nr:hypothetical protein CLIB1423_34S00518 [[Candida] railenensis]
MSSEEDWSIISSSSDLDEDQATIDSQNDDLPASDSNNVSSIATLKIPVLESGSSPKGRSDSGSSVLTVKRGAIRGEDVTADNTVTEVTEGDEEKGTESLDTTAANLLVPVNTQSSGSSTDSSSALTSASVPSSSRIQSTIEYYETIAKEFRSGLTSSFKKHFSSKENVKEIDEEHADTDSSSVSTPEPVLTTEIPGDVDNADHFKQRVDQALAELNNSQTGKNIIFFFSLFTIIVGTFASVYLSSLLFISVVSKVSTAWSPPPVTSNPETSSPFTAFWSQVWKGSPAPVPAPPPPSGVLSYLWFGKGQTPPPPPSSSVRLYSNLKEDVDRFFQSLDKSAVAIYETSSNGLYKLSDKFLKDYDKEYFQRLQEHLDEQFSDIGKSIVQHSKKFSRKSIDFESQLRSNSITIVKFLHRHSIKFGKQFTEDSVLVGKLLQTHSIYWGNKLGKYSKLYGNYVQRVCSTYLTEFTKHSKVLGTELTVQSQTWGNVFWKQSVKTSQQGLKFASACYTKLTACKDYVQGIVEDDQGLIRVFLKDAALQGKRINKAAFSMI